MSEIEKAVLDFKKTASRTGFIQQKTYEEKNKQINDKWERATRNPKSLSNKNSHLFGDYRKFSK